MGKLNLNVADHFIIRTWVNRSERLQMAVKLTFLREWEEVTLGELQQGSATLRLMNQVALLKL
jgi:hypothetical protein